MAAYAQTASLASVTTSATLPIDFHGIGNSPATVLLRVINTPTMTLNVEGTLDNVFDTTVTPVWFALPNYSAKAYSGTGEATPITINYPLRAVRLNVTAYTAGNAQLTVLQGQD